MPLKRDGKKEEIIKLINMIPKTLFSLGEIYPSDFLKEGEQPSTEKVEMKLIIDDNGLVRLEKTAPMNKMYGKYWYRSGINSSMRKALYNIVCSINEKQELRKGDIWLDIACNDGTLFEFVDSDIIKICMDPAYSNYLKESIHKADHVIQDFFSSEAFNKALGGDKAKVITSIAMFYDVPDPVKFIKDVYDILDEDGIWVMQLSYTPLMIRQLAFDNICHEHIYYYSLSDLKPLLENNGFSVVDFELNNVNGGSMRLYIRKDKYRLSITSPEYFKIQSILALEDGMQINSVEVWENFFDDIEELKVKTLTFILEAQAEGKKVWAYGASTKGNTLLQYFGLDETMIDGIADRNPDKWGLRTIGSNIPIFSEEDMRKAKPDYLLILPWHFISEFQLRENDYLSSGGKFIVPCPVFSIIEK